MQELRYVTSENGFLVLENSDGERFRVEINHSLREGSRQIIPSNNARPTSPKQIQILYRAGKTEEQIAAETGESIEFIQMFTPAVQSELDYVTERVQATEFVFGNQMMSFAEIVEMSFSAPVWQSYKAGATWFVRIQQSENEAVWKYEPKLNLLEPHNEIAKKISTGMQDARAIEIVETAATKSENSPKTPQVPIQKPNHSQEDASPNTQRDAEVFSLLDEIRERRLATEKSVDIAAPASEAPPVTKTPPTPKPASAKGRTTLPTWDEIIFGSNNDG